MVIQTNYSINPGIGTPGVLVRPTSPHAMDSGQIRVPTSGRNPQPGDAIYYDRTNNRFALPIDDATNRLVCGILGYRFDTIQEDDQTIQFDNDDFVQIFTMGTVWVRAGDAVEWGDLLRWQTDDYKWNAHTRATLSTSDTYTDAAVNAVIADLGRYPIVCVSPEPVADEGIAMAQIGYGRVA